jgi:predicted nuclease with TOPRIM domain
MLVKHTGINFPNDSLAQADKDVLIRIINHLTSELSEVNSELSEVKSEVSDIREDTDRVSKEVANTRGEVSDIREDTDRVSKEVADTNSVSLIWKKTRIETPQTPLNRILTSLPPRVNTPNQRLSNKSLDFQMMWR